MLHYHNQDESAEVIYSHVDHSLIAEHVDKSTVDLIEDYLDRVCAPLVGSIPRNKREEIRDRVRSRIYGFATAHRELGSSDTEAVELALAQCGDPVLISARWLPELNTAKLSAKTKARLGRNLTERVAGSAKWATCVSTVTLGLPYLEYITGHSDKWWIQHSDNWVTYYRIMLFAVPLTSGLISGVTCKHKPVRGIANAIAILSVPAIIVPGLTAGLAYARVLVGQSGTGSQIFAMPAVCGLVPWLAMGCVGAGIGGSVRKSFSRIATRFARAAKTRMVSGLKSRSSLQFTITR